MSTQHDGPWTERPLGDLVSEYPERHYPIDFHRLVEYRTKLLLQGQCDLNRQNFGMYHTQYRALVRSTIESGQTDPQEDYIDSQFAKWQIQEFGEEAAADSFGLS